LGTSNWQNISYNIDLVRRLNPKTILDVGVGFGRWGILFREYLDVWEHGQNRINWKTEIDGIEIYPGYINEYHSYFYNTIYIEDALAHLRNQDKHYDLINLGDVVEHYKKKDGKELLELSLKHGRYVLMNIPIGKHWEQKGTAENPYEEHKSTWYNSDFTGYKHYIIECFRDFMQRDFSVVLISSGRIVFDKTQGKYFGIKNFLKHRVGFKKTIENFERRKSK